MKQNLIWACAFLMIAAFASCKKTQTSSSEAAVSQQDTTAVAPVAAEPTIPGDYPYLSEREISSSELNGVSKDELRIMRNEIFARHGYIFKSEDLQQHFGALSWYKAQYADVTSMLSDVERKNIQTLKSAEGGGKDAIVAAIKAKRFSPSFKKKYDRTCQYSDPGDPFGGGSTCETISFKAKSVTMKGTDVAIVKGTIVMKDLGMNDTWTQSSTVRVVLIGNKWYVDGTDYMGL